MEETRARLGDIRKNEGKYKDMLQGLLTQVTGGRVYSKCMELLLLLIDALQ